MIAANQNPTLINYTFNEHRHRYAVWTAARAQRAFAPNTKIAEVIEKTSLRSFVEDTTGITQEAFDAVQQQMCTSIINSFSTGKCAYGRAAKIVAIYLKTAVVLPQLGQSDFANVIHPPIDRILLQNIAAKTSLKRFKSLSWTTLTAEAYWAVIDDIRNTLGVCNWKLETYWSINDEE